MFKDLSPFAALDLETMDVKGLQFPVSIAVAYSLAGVTLTPLTKIFVVNHETFKVDPPWRKSCYGYV